MPRGDHKAPEVPRRDAEGNDAGAAPQDKIPSTGCQFPGLSLPQVQETRALQPPGDLFRRMVAAGAGVQKCQQPPGDLLFHTVLLFPAPVHRAGTVMISYYNAY